MTLKSTRATIILLMGRPYAGVGWEQSGKSSGFTSAVRPTLCFRSNFVRLNHMPEKLSGRVVMKSLLLLLLVAAAGCATTSGDRFATPAGDWQTRTGQLAYKGPKMSLIGEVLV